MSQFFLFCWTLSLMIQHPFLDYEWKQKFYSHHYHFNGKRGDFHIILANNTGMGIWFPVILNLQNSSFFFNFLHRMNTICSRSLPWCHPSKDFCTIVVLFVHFHHSIFFFLWNGVPNFLKFHNNVFENTVCMLSR